VSAADYRRASQRVWQVVAPGWDERHAYVERVAGPVTQRMLDRLDAQPNDTILELAAGTGLVGFAAALAVPGTRLILSDFSEPMVEAAHRHGRELRLDTVDYRVLDAEALALPDDSVDRVLCRWGYMLMADPGLALAETRRVLRQGGRLSAAVFGTPDRNPWVALPSRVLVERRHIPPPEAGAPGILALADAQRLGRLFTEAGFEGPQLDDVEFTWEFADEADYWRFLTGFAGAISMVLERLDEAERATVRADLESRLGPYRTDSGLELPAISVVASAS
jgi:SAM-dependent methyltransferase